MSITLQNPYVAILSAIWGIIMKITQVAANNLGISLVTSEHQRDITYEFNTNSGTANPLQWLLHPEEWGCGMSKLTQILKSIHGYTSHIDNGAGKPLCGSSRSKQWIRREGTPTCRFCERTAETGLTTALYYQQVFARKPKQGQVYLIHAIGLSRYKIGCTTISVDKRLFTLQNFSPIALEVLAAIDCSDIEKVEAWLHTKFASCRRHSEWFDLSSDDVQWIMSLTSAKLEEVCNA